MKRRRHTSSPKPSRQRPGKQDREGGRHREREGGPGRSPSRPESQQTDFYGEVRWRTGWDGERAVVRLMNRELAALEVYLREPGDVQGGEILRVRLGGRQTREGVAAELLENLGKNPPGLASLVAIQNHGLPEAFPHATVEDSEELAAFSVGKTGLAGRTDWRELAIVTIDGADARDFDDAVWAEPAGDGHHIIVAIADVAHYVQPGSALDEEARERGNSTYLPDRVIPMLPERLSNDLCSLRPKEDRPVVGVEMWVDGSGKLIKKHFHRGVIHSAARLTYETVQQVLNKDSAPALPKPVLENIAHLEAAYCTLLAAKLARGALDLDLPEAKLVLDDKGQVLRVEARARLDSHRLIEELMILANVAAAEILTSKGGGLYRIHDRPDKAKQLALKASLGPLGFTVPSADAKPKEWARLATQVQEHPAAQSLLRLILQSQQQARYSPGNIGHYGLALPLYAHFTSPIRRYSDLVVHRALIAGLGLPGKNTDEIPDVRDLERLGEHLAITERTSQRAEWEARDRLIAMHYAKILDGIRATNTDKPTFDAVVVGVQTFGLFVAIDGVAEGLLPARMLGDGWQHSPTQMVWMRREQKQVLRAGSKLKVRLVEADVVAGRLTFGMAENEEAHNRPRRGASNFRRRY